MEETSWAAGEAAKKNTDCIYFLASPLTCKKVRLFCFLKIFFIYLPGFFRPSSFWVSLSNFIRLLVAIDPLR